MSRFRRGSPTIHTAIIGDVAGMFSKFAWDLQQFRDIQSAWPSEQQPLAYAAINVCLAASSLQDWVATEMVRRGRAAGQKITQSSAISAIHAAIPAQVAMAAIANTAKHSELDSRWPDGRVEIQFYEGDEDCPPGFVLHHHGQLNGQAIALNHFIDLRSAWWRFMLDHSLVTEKDKYLDWEQSMLKRMFGDPLNEIRQ